MLWDTEREIKIFVVFAQTAPFHCCSGEMGQKIIVHGCGYDENGTRRQDIEIYCSFVGKVDLPE